MRTCVLYARALFCVRCPCPTYRPTNIGCAGSTGQCSGGRPRRLHAPCACGPAPSFVLSSHYGSRFRAASRFCASAQTPRCPPLSTAHPFSCSRAPAPRQLELTHNRVHHHTTSERKHSRLSSVEPNPSARSSVPGRALFCFLTTPSPFLSSCPASTDSPQTSRQTVD